ncbi:MAG: ABC transporter permease [Cyclobacteriaceae bacterium]|nr:ABC transporter permease [Cyclobacteriaceae bacterium]
MKSQKPYPPKLALRFFRWYCRPKLQDYIEGDLLEVYERRLIKSGKRKADLLFAVDVLLLCRPGIIGRKKNHSINQIDMFSNNFKIAIRNLWKNKPSTIINVLGLTTGITACLLIALFIQHELSFDNFQTKGPRIARVVMEYGFEGSTETHKGTFTSTKVAPVLSRTFPEVEQGVRMTDADAVMYLHNEPITEPNFMYADSSFFQTFDYEMVQGNASVALNGPRKMVLTQSMALKYFGTENVLGKTLEVGSAKNLYEITGVVRDYPKNSQLRFDFLASFCSMGQNQEKTYFNANYTTYLLLKDEYAFAPLLEKLDPFMEKEMAGTGATIRFHLEKFNEVHLHSPYPAFTANTSISYLLLLGGVAALILIIVCSTYINLSTAKSIERAKEVGVRKVSGAGRMQLFWQFIGEAFVVCCLSVLVSFCLASLLLPQFNSFVSREFVVADLLTASFLVITLCITLVISFAAGVYPALVLSGMQPARILKGLFKNSSSARSLQQSLVVFQFAITVFLIVCTVIIHNQLTYIKNKNLGYDRAHVLSTFIGWGSDTKQIETFKNELKKHVHINEVARCASTPVSINGGYSMRLPTMPETEVIAVTANPVDEGFVKVSGLQLIAGEDFSDADVRGAESDTNPAQRYRYILNESAVRQLGWTPEEAIGKELILNDGGIIKGVVKDFHFQSVHHALKPLVLFTGPWGGRLIIKISGDDIPGTLAYTEQQWKKFLPNRPFEYSFLDDSYARMYKTENQLGKVMSLFSATAILLACLGLFGLSSYMMQQRMKEIGIRKVLGATFWNLMHILSGNFVKLVVIAIVIASPLAYFLMTNWLNEFAYQTALPWWVFALAGLVVVGITVLTVSIHGIKAMAENPVKSLRSE